MITGGSTSRDEITPSGSWSVYSQHLILRVSSLFWERYPGGPVFGLKSVGHPVESIFVFVLLAGINLKGDMFLCCKFHKRFRWSKKNSEYINLMCCFFPLLFPLDYTMMREKIL